MGTVTFGMRMSLDGFVADQDGDSSVLYPDLDDIADNEAVKEAIRTTGAVILGRRSYDLADGDLTGYEFQVPIFVLTHVAPKQVAKGQNKRLSVTFVTDGIESAVERAKAGAGEKNVQVIGASAGQQCLAAGLLDEVSVAVMPILLGGGTRMFEQMDSRHQLERIRVIEMPVDTELRFRVVK